eukprot:1157321-Pelagomonas_calceolata.AAC.1
MSMSNVDCPLNGLHSFSHMVTELAHVSKGVTVLSVLWVFWLVQGRNLALVCTRVAADTGQIYRTFKLRTDEAIEEWPLF